MTTDAAIRTDLAGETIHVELTALHPDELDSPSVNAADPRTAPTWVHPSSGCTRMGAPRGRPIIAPALALSALTCAASASRRRRSSSAW